MRIDIAQVNKGDKVIYAGDFYIVEASRHNEMYSFLTLEGETVRFKATATIIRVDKKD